MILGLVILSVGLALSAFFSGSETGFYRANRVRLVIQAKQGDWISKGLLSLVNHPTMFVATALIGNNVANYITSLSIVLLTQTVTDASSNAVELAATVFFSPLVFVYGELLPKNFFYSAPNLLLRRSGPLLFVFSVLFSPVAVLLGLLGVVLQRLMGETPLRVRGTLARQELQQVLIEGQEAGILQPAQRHLAQGLFGLANAPVTRYMAPMSRTASIRWGSTRQSALRLARRRRAPVLIVRGEDGKESVGYVQAIDLCLSAEKAVTDVRPLLKVQRTESYIDALLQLQREKEELAAVVDPAGRMIGLLHANELVDQLFRDRSR